MSDVDFKIGGNAPCYVIAEAGVNHNGRVERALELIERARAAGADAIKFQTFRASELVVADAPGADYQQRNLGRAVRQLDLLQSLELSDSDFRRLADRARSIGITFLSTPFDARSADLLDELDVPLFKLGSGELTHHSLLSHIARKGKPMVLSTGMADLDEVRVAVELVRQHNDQLMLLHCVSCYPADSRDLNLRAIRTLSQEFCLPVGFSDHTRGTHMAPLAVALGACMIEKHFTLDRTLPGPDHLASLEPDELAHMIARIREAEVAFGDGIKVPASAESAVAAAARRSWVASAPLSAGTRIGPEHLALRRPGTGIPESDVQCLLGQTLCRSIAEGTILSMDDLEVRA